uniref:Uncharacterized protein n=1 Tax=Avena sativa TaxID=4498 RepID=A0ACD5V587_AVESA
MSSPALAPAAPNPRLDREAVVRAVEALLRWLKHRPSPAPEAIYLLVALKSAPIRRFEHHLRLPHYPFPSTFLVADRLPDDLPDDIEVIPSSLLRSLTPVARRGLVLVDSRLKIPTSGKGIKGHGRIVPVDLADPAWATSAREAACCVELRVEAGTCRAVRVGHAAMAPAEAVENVVAAVEAAAACVPRKWKNVRALHLKSPESVALPLYSAPSAEGSNGAKDTREPAVTLEQGRLKRRKK